MPPITTTDAAVIAIANYLADHTVPVYMTAAEVASATRLDVNTVRIFARDGRIKSFQVGTERRFTPAQVREFVEHDAGKSKLSKATGGNAEKE